MFEISNLAPVPQCALTSTEPYTGRRFHLQQLKRQLIETCMLKTIKRVSCTLEHSTSTLEHSTSTVTPVHFGYRPRARPKAKSKVPEYSRLWHRVKVDSGKGLPKAHGKCVGVHSGVDIRWDYSQLRHRVP
jgi:hypothetical protein